MFIDDITDHLTSLLLATTNNVILGEFNMHINDKSSNDVVIFNDTLMAPGLTQHVTPLLIPRAIYLISSLLKR